MTLVRFGGESEAVLDGFGEGGAGGGGVVGDDVGDVVVEFAGGGGVADPAQDLFEFPVVVSDCRIADEVWRMARSDHLLR